MYSWRQQTPAFADKQTNIVAASYPYWNKVQKPADMLRQVLRCAADPAPPKIVKSVLQFMACCFYTVSIIFHLRFAQKHLFHATPLCCTAAHCSRSALPHCAAPHCGATALRHTTSYYCLRAAPPDFSKVLRTASAIMSLIPIGN